MIPWGMAFVDLFLKRTPKISKNEVQRLLTSDIVQNMSKVLGNCPGSQFTPLISVIGAPSFYVQPRNHEKSGSWKHTWKQL